MTHPIFTVNNEGAQELPQCIKAEQSRLSWIMWRGSFPRRKRPPPADFVPASITALRAFAAVPTAR